MAFDLVDMAMHPELPICQNDYFKPQFLRNLFDNKISRTQASGKDGTRVGNFTNILDQEIEIIVRKIFAGSYRFTIYKERLILKGAGKEPRIISIPTVRDRLTLRAICELLQRAAPRAQGPTPHAVVGKVMKALSECDGSFSFVRIDVQNFFPSIKHNRLIAELERNGIGPIPLSLIAKAIQNPTGSASAESDRGVPQGLSISGALAQIFMIPFDESRLFNDRNYFRYVDDILLITKTIDAHSDFKKIQRSLGLRGLKVHPVGSQGKTEIKAITDGIDFLGYHICKNKKVSIRDSSYRRMFKNIMKIFTDYKYRKNLDRSLFRLKLKITGCLIDSKRRGWMMFFSMTEETSQLRFLDEFVMKKARAAGFPISSIH